MKILMGALVPLTALVLLAAPALAQLGISPGSMDLLVPHGEHTLPSVTVRNDSDKVMDFEAHLAGYGHDVLGSTQVLEPDTNPLSAVAHIRINPAKFRLEPGGRQDVRLAVFIPPGTDGGRYAVVLIVGTPAGEEAVRTVSRLGVLVRLTIAGSEVVEQGSIRSIGTEAVESGAPIPVKVTYANEGNAHYKVQSSVTIFDVRGGVLDVVRSRLTLVLPGYARELVADWIPGRELEPGVYSALGRVLHEDGTLLDEAEGSFEVGVPYLPPAPPVSITLTAAGAAVLRTDDGRISISFATGSVFSDVDISLRGCPADQLAPAPPGYRLAATAFRVDGLPGPLAKQAMLTVRYLPADLNIAEGEAARLKLARWSEAEGRWTVLKTRLDQEAVTISATTNRLSIWAVMVAPAASVNRALAGGLASGGVLLGLLVYFLGVRRRRTT
jgi:hypothetical protein